MENDVDIPKENLQEPTPYEVWTPLKEKKR